MRHTLFSLVTGLLLAGGAVAAPAEGSDQATGLLTRTVTISQNSYDYQVFIPAGLKASEKAPVILFLHGIGQRGEGGFVPSNGGASEVVRSYMNRLPAIVVLPQCRSGRYWHEREMTEMAMATLDKTVSEFGGDKERLYLIGVSMGGYGAWHMAAEHSGRFAAFVPICGGSPLRSRDRFKEIARRVGRTPVWVFHGVEDKIVPVSESREMVEALKATGGNVRYNEYPGVGHNVWLKVASENELLPWLLKQRLGKSHGATRGIEAGKLNIQETV
jgi:predicted peptidase